MEFDKLTKTIILFSLYKHLCHYISKHMLSFLFDKPQLKPKAKAKSKAKAWAEVVYIITKSPVPSRARARACARPAQSIHSLNHKSN